MTERTALILGCLVGLLTSIVHAQPAAVSRILRTFDFEERRLGNVEDVPMNWSKVDGPGLPHYVNGGLTNGKARSGKYSFRFDLNGGSLIYRYQSGQIKVQSEAHYRVEGFVQTTPMPNARARLTAYFTDSDGHPITSSIHHSELYSAPSDTADWKNIAVDLSAGDPDATFLVVELGLLNPAAYSPAELGQHTLFPQDIRGTAWFDDVTVSQVPQVTLSTDRPGNVFRLRDPLKLSVLVNDRFTDDLSAQLVVHDARDRIVYQKSGALDMSTAEKLGPGQKRMSLSLPDNLPPGWYSAALEMTSQGQFVGRQSIDLVLLADEGKPLVPDSRFGLVATDLPFEGWRDLPAILELLSAGRVKLAVWNDQGDIQQRDAAAFDRLLEQLQELQITPTACLLSLPPNVREKIRARSPAVSASSLDTRSVLAAAKNPWLEILKAPPDTWQPQLAYMVARHANHLERWQLGEDGTDAFVTTRDMRQVYRKVYAEFANLVQKPDLAMPWPAWYELDGEMPATIALHVSPDVLPSQLPLYMADVGARAVGQLEANNSASSPGGAASQASTAVNSGPRNLSVFLQPLDDKQYGREMQIRDLAQRVCYALSADAQRIDITLPFNVRRDGDKVGNQPRELLIVVRTLMRMLGNATFKGKVPIADGVEAFLFDRNGQGVLMLWDRGNDAGVKQLALNLGQRPMRVDLWGNVTPLWNAGGALRASGSAKIGSANPASLEPAARSVAPDSTSVSLELGPMPVFLVDIDGQLAQLRASVAFDNDHIESSFKAHTRRLRFTNPYRTAISGSVKLTPPKGWNINPPTQTFNLNPNETFDREITIEFPYNSFAGPKTILADFQVQAESNSRFTVPMVLKLGLSDVGLQTIALRDGKDVIVQQMITNYGEKPIGYTSYAIYPGQARQERIVTNLAPGRTTIKKYRFNDVAITPDAKVRSGVRELVGTRILNDEVAIQ